MNGVGVALMIVVFAHTGGLVGAEIGVAGGRPALAQRVLEAVFGDQAVRRLAETAKEDLDARVQALMANELLRYHAALGEPGQAADQAATLRAAADQVGRARAADPVSAEAPAALSSAPVPPALEGTEVRQLPAGSVGDANIVEAEARRG